MASRSWNRVELIGNLTKDPELRYTPNGSAVCTFGIATNRTYVSDGEKKEEVDFHRLVAWNKLAELCSQLLKKGNRVFISGRLQNRSWEAQDGQTKQLTEIVIEDMILLTPKGNGESTFRDDINVDDLAATPAPKPPEVKPASEPQPEANEPEAVSSKAQEDEEEKPKPPAPKEDVDEDLPF